MLSQKAISPVQYSSIEDRPDVVINGETIVELTTPILSPTQKIGISSITPIRPSSQMSARPDLVSLAMTRTANKADEIMYFNEISNPFSVSDEHVFFLPDPTDTSNAKETSKSEISKWTKRKTEVSQSQKELNKNANVQDKKRIIELMKQNDPKGVQEAFRLSGISEAGVNLETGKTATLDELMSSLDILRTPGMTTEEQTQRLQGKLVFGTNVINKKCTSEITTTQGKSQTIRQNLLKKIKTKQLNVPRPTPKPVVKQEAPKAVTVKDVSTKTNETGFTTQIAPLTHSDSLTSGITLDSGVRLGLSTVPTKNLNTPIGTDIKLDSVLPKTTITQNPMERAITNAISNVTTKTAKIDLTSVSVPLKKEISIKSQPVSTQTKIDLTSVLPKNDVRVKTLEAKTQKIEFKAVRNLFEDR